MSNIRSVVGLNIKFYNGSTSTIDIGEELASYDYFMPIDMWFTVNWKNISTNYKNQLLYVDSNHLAFVLVPQGLYTINDLNNSVLVPQINTFYYAIQRQPGDDAYYIYQYNSSSDRTSMINGTK